jgi:hypothetical protein
MKKLNDSWSFCTQILPAKIAYFFGELDNLKIIEKRVPFNIPF